MTREEKIKLLEGLRSGIITIDTFSGRSFRIEVNTIDNGGDGRFYINDKEVLPEVYSREVVKNQKGDKIIIMINGLLLHEYIDFVHKEREITGQSSKGPTGSAFINFTII